MKRTESIYLSLLRAGLWDTKAHLEGAIDWKAVLALAYRQSTAGLICHAALQLECGQIPSAIQTQMQAILMKFVNAHAMTNRTIARTVAMLQEKGIHVVLLKGQGVASYYAAPLLRQCGDIDLYVDDYAVACDSIMTDDGGRRTEDGGRRTEDGGRRTDDGGRKTEDGGRRTEDGGRKALALSRSEATDKHTEFDLGGGLSLEIHEYTETLDDAKKNVMYQTFSDEGTTTGLVPIVFNGISVSTPEDTFNAFYIFHHLWHHTIGLGMGLRQVCDWAVFLRTHAGQLDEERLKHYLKAMNLMDEWQVFGSLVVHCLHLTAEEIPFYSSKNDRRGRRLLHYILNEGDNRDFKFGRSTQRTKKKAATLRYIFSKTRRLLPIFPRRAMTYFLSGIWSGVKKNLSSPK